MNVSLVQSFHLLVEPKTFQTQPSRQPHYWRTFVLLFMKYCRYGLLLAYRFVRLGDSPIA